jgi:hypothetical protein
MMSSGRTMAWITCLSTRPFDGGDLRSTQLQACLVSSSATLRTRIGWWPYVVVLKAVTFVYEERKKSGPALRLSNLEQGR